MPKRQPKKHHHQKRKKEETDEQEEKEKEKTSKEQTEPRQKAKGNVFRVGGGKKVVGGRNKITSCELRIQADLAELDPEATPGVKVDWPNPKDLKFFKVEVTPTEGLWAKAKFSFAVTVPHDYPFHAPTCVCDTLVYHPNIDFKGRVCLNILRHDWKPVLTLSHVIFGLMTLFLEPNPDDPLNIEAAKLMADDNAQFRKNVEASLRGKYVAGHQFPKLI